MWGDGLPNRGKARALYIYLLLLLSLSPSTTLPASWLSSYNPLDCESIQMVLLVITPRILSAIEAVPSPRRKDLDLPESPGLNAAISHEQLIGLSRHLKSSVEDGDRVPWTLNTLLRGTKVYVPPPPKKPEPVRISLALRNQRRANTY